MDGTGATYCGEEECVGVFIFVCVCVCGNLKEKDNLKHVGIDGRGILK